MPFKHGDDVMISFDGLEHPGRVLTHAHGWVMAEIRVDDQADYGALSARLVPCSTVCVPESRVRHPDKTSE